MDLVNTAEKIISGQLQLLDFEGETITYVNESTDLKIIKHYYNGTFYGFNLYARDGQNLILLETYNSKQAAEKVLHRIKQKLSNGALSYELPTN